MKKYLALLLLVSCQSNFDDELDFSNEPAPVPVPQLVEQQKEAIEEKKVAAVFTDTAYFAYDSSSLSMTARQDLAQNVLWLNENPKAKLTIEGHCDERGTKEYNMALGEKRAYAVKNFLVAGGIKASRLQTVSYGEEKPAVLGTSDKAFAKNRRSVLVAN